LLQRLDVPLPALDEQREIADALAVLDDKMAMNQRMNRTLLKMSRSLFRACFMDFDPAVGAQFPPIDLYPRGFTEEAGLRAPVGWEVRPIGEVVHVVGGATPSTRRPEFWNGVFHWTTPKDLSPLEMPVLLNTERRITDLGVGEVSSGLLPAGTVLLSSRAPIGYLAITEVPVAVNQGFIALRSDGVLGKQYLLHWLATHMDLVLSRANGTTFLEVSKSAFRPLPILVPPVNVRAWFEDVAGQFHSQIVTNLRQNAALRITRDALIPQLMSGAVRVADLRREVG
jgi:type I restriction enzyme S subunit